MHPERYLDAHSLDRDVPSSESAFQLERIVRKQATLIFCLLMFCYSYVHQRPGWNQNSRLDLLHAILVHKTLNIDAYHENTGDKSIHNGHYYSDKAPGIVVLALPAFALSAGILRLLDIDIDSPKGWLISDWITTALSVGFITALGAAAMFLFLCKLIPRPYAFLTSLAVFLGSSPFPYATMLFSHAAVIGLVCIALWAIADQEFLIRHIPDESKIKNQKSKIGATLNWRKRHILAGLCCGFAIASEFPAAIAAGGVLVLALLTASKRGFLLALAAIPPLLLIPTYNWACFGGPVSFGYHNLALAEFHGMNDGVFGITFPPKPGAAYLLLASLERGLFFWSPFFLLAFFGWGRLWKVSRSLLLLSSSVVLVQILAISGYYMPSGGAALGARHLAPMLPFLAIASAFGVTYHTRPFAYALACLSILLSGFGTAVQAMIPETVDSPLTSFYAPYFMLGRLAPNIGRSLGFSPHISLLPLFLALSAFFAGPFLWRIYRLGNKGTTRSLLC